MTDAVLALEPGGGGGHIGAEAGEGDPTTVVEDHRLLVAELEGVLEDLAQRPGAVAQHTHGLAADVLLHDLERAARGQRTHRRGGRARLSVAVTQLAVVTPPRRQHRAVG